MEERIKKALPAILQSESCCYNGVFVKVKSVSRKDSVRKLPRIISNNKEFTSKLLLCDKDYMSSNKNY